MTLFFCYASARSGLGWQRLNANPQHLETMTRQELETRLQAIHAEHRTLHQATVEAVNEYMNANPDGLTVTQQANPSGPWKIETLVHDMLHNAAWIEDRLAKRTGSIGNPDYKHSLTRKLRRIMGYTQP